MTNQAILRSRTRDKRTTIYNPFRAFFAAVLLLGTTAFVQNHFAGPTTAASISPTEMGIIVPAYFFPYDGNNPGQHNVGPYWSSLIEAAKVLGDRLIVIANPGSGPGTGTGWEHQKYTEAINKVRAEGAKVIGYVYTCYALTSSASWCTSRTIANVHADIDNWYNWYALDGIFLDEVSADPAQVQWYQDLHTYIRGKSSTALVCNNFGMQPNSNYFSIDAISCVYENYTANFDAGVNFSYMTTAQKEKALVLLHSLNTGTWNTRFQTLQNAGIKWFYITNDQMNNPWDVLPPFFEEMVDQLAPPPFAHWDFNEGSGTTTACSNGTNTGTVTDKSVTGKNTPPNWLSLGAGNGYAISFDSSYVEVANPEDFNMGKSDFSFEAWIKYEAPAHYGVILGKYNHFPLYYMRLNPGGRIDARIATVQNSTTKDITLNGPNVAPDTWYHLVAVFDRDGKLSLYSNGQKYANSRPITGMQGDSLYHSQPFRIGAHGSLSSVAYPFKGLIDEVKVYKRLLSDAEILEKFNAGRASHP